MRQYIVTRYGCNASNQHMQQEMVLGVYAGRDAAQAKAAAIADGHTVYNNQYLGAIPLSRAPAALVREAVEEAGLKAHYQGSHDAR